MQPAMAALDPRVWLSGPIEFTPRAGATCHGIGPAAAWAEPLAGLHRRACCALPSAALAIGAACFQPPLQHALAQSVKPFISRVIDSTAASKRWLVLPR
jgi:hypothetical protein